MMFLGRLADEKEHPQDTYSSTLCLRNWTGEILVCEAEIIEL